MMNALICGAVCGALYGLFLFIRGLFRLKKTGEHKMFGWCLGLFCLGLLILGLGLLIKLEAINSWIALPILLVLFMMFSAGYFLESYLRHEKRRRADGLDKIIPARPKHWLRNNLILLVVALIIWAVGAFIGFSFIGLGDNKTFEISLLCICMFLVARALSSLWKYRGF